MVLTKRKIGRSIAVIVRGAATFGALRARQGRPVTAEEAEAWSLRRQERSAKLKAEANATLWPLSQ